MRHYVKTISEEIWSPELKLFKTKACEKLISFS